jgi:hypothetical protein
MRSKVGRKQLDEMSVIIYSQNLRGMNHDKEDELIQKLKAKKVWVALLQETWKPGQESYENQGFREGGGLRASRLVWVEKQRERGNVMLDFVTFRSFDHLPKAQRYRQKGDSP